MRRIDRIYKEVSDELNIPVNVVRSVYQAYSKRLMDVFRDCDKTLEQKSVNLPEIGKIYFSTNILKNRQCIKKKNQ